MKIVFTVLLSLTLLFVTCKKSKTTGCTDPVSVNYNADAEEDDNSCQYAGLGGNTTLVAYPKHHGNSIRPYHAYLKFNSQDLPGTHPAAFDLNIPADTTKNHIKIQSLKPGKYYIYMMGYDSAIAAGVVGGIPITLTATSGEVSINVPVVE